MAYDLGNPELDALINRLVEQSSDSGNQDLIAELITTAIKLHRDGATRGDLKLINTALKEMRYSNLVFSRHDEPKVTIYGSARLEEEDANYQVTVDFARLMVEHGWGVVTGAGPGIMEAGNRGAGIDKSYGVNIRLPFEGASNRYLAPERTVNFKYFFTRKLAFVKESHAFALFPGGFGTQDEAFELLTLVQTGKSDLHPIVLLEAEGSGYWQAWLDFVAVLERQEMISPDDTSLFLHTNSVEEACAEITHFYSCYHSQRYVDGRLVLRLQKEPPRDLIRSIDSEFRDIVTEGRIERVSASQREIDDEDHPQLPRIALNFDRRHLGRLRLLVDRLNDGTASQEA